LIFLNKIKSALNTEMLFQSLTKPQGLLTSCQPKRLELTLYFAQYFTQAKTPAM